ncbi:hypothetical protein BH11PLA1_BH11PLA1_04150 [soil metagenome]
MTTRLCGVRGVVAAGALALSAALLPACNLLAPFGAIAENIHHESSTTYEPEYSGLKGKTFAVIVTADRATQAEYPAVVARFATLIAKRIKEYESGTTGFIPGERVLQYQFDHPRWVSMTYEDLGKTLGVDRLIIVEMLEYRLVDPGNKYLWKGLSRCNVGVVEVDSALPDDMAFRKAVTVNFPDTDGYSPADMSGDAVNTVLSNRMIDRVSWLFYTHDEANKIKY